MSLPGSLLARALALQPRTNAFVSLCSEAAIQGQLRALASSSGASGKTMAQWTVAVKDNFCTGDGLGLATTAASAMLRGFTPQYDATVCALIRDAGAIVIGKTNMDEFGMGSESRFTAYGGGPVTFEHPSDGSRRVAGGSSGGSAVAVALEMARVAIGSDTGGSVRLPASYCGVYGFKPTYGAYSRHGLIAYASSLDCPGTMAQSVADLEVLHAILNKHDPNDPTSYRMDEREAEASKAAPVTSLKDVVVGVPESFVTSDLPEHTGHEWERAILDLESKGAKIKTVDIPSVRHALPAYYVIASAEASSNLARYDGVEYGHRSKLDDGSEETYARNTRSEGFGAEVQRRLLAGTFVLSAQYYDSYYLQAQKVRRVIHDEFVAAFESNGVHALLTPTAPSCAPTLEAVQRQDRSKTASFLLDLFTVPASLAGLPAISLPFARSRAENLPLGMQLIGRRLHDHQLLSLSRLWMPSQQTE